MPQPPETDTEQARLSALHRYNVLDASPAPALDDITRLTTRVCQTPVALISFIDGEREWFKARLGLNASSLTRDVAFGVHTLLQNDILIVSDTQADDRFADNPLVAYPPYIKFYAGVTLLTPDGFAIGTLSVFDLKPRDLTPHQVDALRILGRQVMALLELDLKESALTEARSERERLERDFGPGSPLLAQHIVDSIPAAYIVRLPDGAVLFANSQVPPWGLADDQARNEGVRKLLHVDDGPRLDDHYRRLASATEAEVIELEYRVKDAKGRWRWYASTDAVFARSQDRSVAQIFGTAHDITERKKQEEALRHSEARYRHWIETARPGIWVIDSKERTTLVNPRMSELLAYAMDEMLGAPLSNFMDEADQEVAAAHLERVRQGAGEDYEFKFKRKDGDDLWAIVSTAPVLDASGHYAGAFAVVTDITGRRTLEETLRESEERFRQLAGSLPQFFWISSPDMSQVFYASPAYEAIWRRSLQSLYEQPVSFMDAIHPDDRERVRIALQEELPQDNVVEYRMVRPDGSIRWIASRAFPIGDGPGAPDRIAGIAEDITARKATEEAQVGDEASLRSLAEAIPDMVFRFDSGGLFTDFRSAAENLPDLLMPPEEFLGRHYRDVLPPQVSSVIEDALQRAQTEKSIQTFEYSLTLPTSRTQYFEARLSTDAQGNSLAIVRNITRRKQAELELEAQKRLFQNLVAVARATVALPTLEETLQNVLDISVTMTGSTRGVLFVCDTNGRVTRSLSSNGQKTEVAEGAFVDELLEKGLEGRVLRERKAIIIDDTPTDDRWLRLAGEEYPFGSALGVPIVYGESPAGIITLLHEQKAYFTEEHLNLMQAAADEMSLVLRNAQIYEQTRRQAHELYMLNRITRAALESNGPDDLLQTLADGMGELIGADGCLITLWDPIGQRPVPRAASGTLRDSQAAITAEPGDVTMTGSVLDAGRALVAEDVSDSPYMSRRIAERLPVRSLLGLPLIARNQKLGVVLIGFSDSHAFSPEEVALCEQAAGPMALALSNAILFQAIGEERSRLMAIIEASRDGILLIGLNGRFLVCNDIAMRILAAPGRPEDWIGKTVPEVLKLLRRTAPNAVRATIAEVRRIQGNDETPGEGEYDVHGRAVHWHHLPVKAQGVLLGLLVVMRDITGERSLERVRNDLTHMMVHDLRSPLTAIIGAADTLDETMTGLTANERGTLDLIRDGADRMLGLVNDILDVSQLESNRMPIEREAVEVPALVGASLQLQASQIEKKQLRLANDVPADLPPAYADSRLIERVLQNLIGNAINYTPEGGALRISAEAVDAERPMLMISVSDTGPGIPPEIQGRVFEKFVRGDHKEHGSGLGLAFCRLAVEAHEGRIWVDSESGMGTTIRFTLPRAETGS